MAKLVSRFDSDVKTKGDTVHIPNVSNLTAYDKSANSEVTLQTATESSTDISINKHKHVAFEVEDMAKVQSAYDLKENLGSFYSNVDIKNREFGENRETTIPSRATTSGGCNDYVRFSYLLIGRRDSLNSMGTLRA